MKVLEVSVVGSLLVMCGALPSAGATVEATVRIDSSCAPITGHLKKTLSRKLDDVLLWRFPSNCLEPYSVHACLPSASTPFLECPGTGTAKMNGAFNVFDGTTGLTHAMLCTVNWKAMPANCTPGVDCPTYDVFVVGHKASEGEAVCPPSEALGNLKVYKPPVKGRTEAAKPAMAKERPTTYELALEVIP